MRIRKRPSSSHCPSLASLPLSPDLSLHVPPPNGGRGNEDNSGGGRPVSGDLPIDPHESGRTPNGGSTPSPPRSDPYRDAKGRRSRSMQVPAYLPLCLNYLVFSVALPLHLFACRVQCGD
ncbi:hypothetical protein BHM03_00021501 [Ensete ventricosum]|nr:hypothetical protein BHM03_00021501 [Ensete ventricosum]